MELVEHVIAFDVELRHNATRRSLCMRAPCDVTVGTALEQTLSEHYDARLNELVIGRFYLEGIFV